MRLQLSAKETALSELKQQIDKQKQGIETLLQQKTKNLRHFRRRHLKKKQGRKLKGSV